MKVCACFFDYDMNNEWYNIKFDIELTVANTSKLFDTERKVEYNWET